MKPSLFIASSVEGLDVAYAVQKNLMHDAEVTIWSQGIFNPSNYTLEDLVQTLENVDFGVFVFSADDESIIREEKTKTIRDNVLFELGLFMGKLGRKRVFSLKPNNINVHIPSDLLGINILSYENNRQDKNLEAGTGVACNDIRNVIKSQGIIERNLAPLNPSEQVENEKEDDSKTNLEKKLKDLLLKKEFKKCIDVIDTMIADEKDDDKGNNLKRIRAHIHFKCNIEEGEREFNKLIIEANSEKKMKIVEDIANIYFMEEDYNRCIKYIDECDEKSAVLSMFKARSYAKIGKKEEYIKYLQEVIKEYDSIELKLQYFDMMNENSQEYSVEDRLKYIISLYMARQNEEQIISKYAIFAHYTILNFELALYLWNKLCTKSMENSTYLTHLANAYYQLNLTNSSIEAYEKANGLEEGERAKWIWSNMGNFYNSRGLHLIGKRYLNKAIEIDKNDDYVLRRLVDTVQAEKNEKELIEKHLNSARKFIYEM